MATGYLARGVCHASISDAEAAVWAGVPVTVSPGATSHLVTFSFQSGQWVTSHYTLDSSGAAALLGTAAVPSLTFPSCDTTESFFDGVTLGWGVSIPLILAAAFLAMRKGLPW